MFSCSRVFVLAAVVAVLSGCQEKTETSRTTEAPNASAEKPRGKVEQAFANAVKAGSAPAAANSSGPPADGVMDPVRAESEVASGTAPKLAVGGEGTGTKFLLRSERATLPKSLSMELSIQSGSEQGLPPILVSLGLESKKGDSSAVAYQVVAKIRDVKLSMPNAPVELTQQLAGLKGGKVSFSMSSLGAGFGFSVELAKGARPELRELLEAVSEGFALLTVPVPSVPMGVGAFWMVSSREVSSGIGLISYRMVKLTSVSDAAATLEYDGRRYAVGRAIDPAMLPPGSPPAALRELAAAAKETFKIAVDSALATEMESSSGLRGALDAGDAPGPQGQPSQRMLQAGTAYRMTAVK